MNPEHKLLMLAPSAVAGGMEEILFYLAVCLPSLGIACEVVSLQPGPLVERLAAHAVPVRVIDAGQLRDLRRFGGTVRRLTSIMRDEAFDAVFSDMPKAHLYAAFPALRAEIPSLWCQAGVPAPPHWTDRAASLLPATGIVALSRDAVAAQQELSPQRHVALMHPGIDTERFVVRADPALRETHHIASDAVLVSLVGRLQPWKGQREFLRAAALLADRYPQAHFAIVGGAILGWEGDYPEELRRLATELGLNGRVTFTGHTSEVPRWMAASDVVVNASQPEPFGLVVVEAMAAGCAVVAVATGGPRDIIEDGRCGLLCPSQAPAALRAPLELLLDDPGLRSRLGAAGRRRVEDSFSLESMAGAFAGILRRALAGQAA
jgi:glycosyltransferase involved in cell wall biosynthesis